MINRNVLAAFVLGSACLTGRTAADPLKLFSPATEIDEINGARRRDLIARQWDLNLQFYGWGGYGYGPAYVDHSEPWWQGVPGSMWSYRRQWPIWDYGRQWPSERPIGHESGQNGPNRWIDRPRYARPEELPAPGRGYMATSTGVDPQLPTPSEPVPEVFRPAGRRKNKRSPGQRDF